MDQSTIKQREKAKRVVGVLSRAEHHVDPTHAHVASVAEWPAATETNTITQMNKINLNTGDPSSQLKKQEAQKISEII